MEPSTEGLIPTLQTKKLKKKGNPRTVRGARRMNWHVVDVPGSVLEKNLVSWLGVMIWTDRNTDCKYVQSFQTREFAFENEADASKFILKWLW